MTKTPDGGLSQQTDANNVAKSGNSPAPAAAPANSALENSEAADRASRAREQQASRDLPEGDVRRTRDGREYDKLDNRERRPQEDLGPNAPVSGEETKDIVQARLDKRSAGNEEGHAKNMEAEEKKYEKHETVEGEDGAIGKPDPKLGREDNGNTPIVNKDGSKTWTPPGVAFARK